MLVNVHYAKSQLSKLIAAAESGDDVVIVRNGKPAVRLVPVQPRGFRLWHARAPRHRGAGLRPADER